MKISILLFLLLCVAVAATHAQSTNDYGTIDELRGLSKVYVSANAGDREAIIKEIRGSKSGLTVANSMEEADFYLNFQVTQNNRVGFANLATGQLDVYLRKGERLRTVWLKEGTDGAFKNAVAKGLIKKFLKDFINIRK